MLDKNTNGGMCNRTENVAVNVSAGSPNTSENTQPNGCRQAQMHAHTGTRQRNSTHTNFNGKRLPNDEENEQKHSARTVFNRMCADNKHQEMRVMCVYHTSIFLAVFRCAVLGDASFVRCIHQCIGSADSPAQPNQSIPFNLCVTINKLNYLHLSAELSEQLAIPARPSHRQRTPSEPIFALIAHMKCAPVLRILIFISVDGPFQLCVCVAYICLRSYLHLAN